MSNEFRNAFHFVPRKPPLLEDLRALPIDQAPFGLTPQTLADGHAVYADGTHSGRIVCTVTLECPVVIGAKRHTKQQKEKPSEVEPFLFKGRPAIPASSMKGVISAVAEAASRAPYRVLENMMLSVAYSPSGDPRKNWKPVESGSNPAGMGTSFEYFNEGQHPASLSRSQVSPAEAMFGYVRDAAGSEDTKGRLMAVAGKLRFSHALLDGDWLEKRDDELFLAGDNLRPSTDIPDAGRYTTVKELTQPMKDPKRKIPGPNDDKLRSAVPSFYFRSRDSQKKDDFITKVDFANNPPSQFEAMGGKFYLHHDQPNQGEPWKSRLSTTKTDRRAAVRPLRAGVTFCFDIDFDNLTDRELNLLCFALRPSERFRHKIGMGKALGLGSIRIDPVSLVLIDRRKRYSAKGLFTPEPRAHQPGEASRSDIVSRAATHQEWLAQNDARALKALRLIGETHDFDGKGGADSKVPVLWVPLAESRFRVRHASALAETESYSWFSNNEKSPNKQRLKPIGSSETIPTLRTNYGWRNGTIDQVKTDRAGRHYAVVTCDDKNKTQGHVSEAFLQEIGMSANERNVRVRVELGQSPNKSEKQPVILIARR